MRLRSTLTLSAAGLAVSALALAGCSTGTAADAGTTGLSVVASTNVYGSIATALGGDLVTVTSLIDSAAQDPHSFEASARDQLSLSKADLVIENGGGYDPFVETLLDAASATHTPLLTAADVVDLPEGTNEHLWYSFADMEQVATAISAEYSELDAANAAIYGDNLTAFLAQLDTLEAAADALTARTAGLGAAITEPVPLYLLEEAGFTNRTPAEFSEAIEEGTDVPPLVLRDTLAIFGDGSVSLLAYNSQTAGAETEQVRAAAGANGVAVVDFTETLPDGADYISWMTQNLDAIATALN